MINIYQQMHAQLYAQMLGQGLMLPMTCTYKDRAGTAQSSGTFTGVPALLVWDCIVIDTFEAGEPEDYLQDGMTLGEGTQVFCIPKVFNTEPRKYATCTFAGSLRRVRNVKPFAPNGFMCFKLILSE